MREPPTDFVIMEGEGKWQLRASPQRVLRIVATCCVAGVTALGGGCVIDYWQGSHAVAVFGCVIASVTCGISIWAWLLREVSLSIETRTGAVHFGKRQLCGPGTVESVVLHRDTGSDDGKGCSFGFRLTDETIVEIHSPGFARMGDLASTTALAEQVAAKLNVRVVGDWEVVNKPRWRVAATIGFGLLAMFVSIVVLTFDGVLGWTVYRQIRAESYAATRGVVTHSAAQATFRAAGGFSESADIKYKYQVAGKEYSGDRYRFGNISSNDDGADRIVREYPLGKQVLVYYHPADPAESLLRPGLAGCDLFLAMFLLPFNLIMFCAWWVVGKKARGLRLVPVEGTPLTVRGVALRVRVPRFRPRTLATIVAGLVAFGATFVVGFGFGGFHPSMPVMGIAWTAVLACGGWAYVAGRRMLAADGSDEFMRGTDS